MWYLAWLWTSSDWQCRPFSSFWALKMVGFLGKLLGQEIQVLQVFQCRKLGMDGNKGASCCARKKRRKLKVRNLQQNDLRNEACEMKFVWSIRDGHNISIHFAWFVSSTPCISAMSPWTATWTPWEGFCAHPWLLPKVTMTSFRHRCSKYFSWSLWKTSPLRWTRSKMESWRSLPHLYHPNFLASRILPNNVSSRWCTLGSLPRNWVGEVAISDLFPKKACKDHEIRVKNDPTRNSLSWGPLSFCNLTSRRGNSWGRRLLLLPFFAWKSHAFQQPKAHRIAFSKVQRIMIKRFQNQQISGNSLEPVCKLGAHRFHASSHDPEKSWECRWDPSLYTMYLFKRAQAESHSWEFDLPTNFVWFCRFLHSNDVIHDNCLFFAFLCICEARSSPDKLVVLHVGAVCALWMQKVEFCRAGGFNFSPWRSYRNQSDCSLFVVRHGKTWHTPQMADASLGTLWHHENWARVGHGRKRGEPAVAGKMKTLSCFGVKVARQKPSKPDCVKKLCCG